MLSEAQIKRVWEGMLGSEIRANYFAEMSGRFLKLQKWGTWAVLFFSSADLVSFVTRLPDGYGWVRFALAALTTAASVYLAISQNEQQALSANELHARWNRLRRDYEAIWEDIEAPGAAEKLMMIGEQEDEASKAGTGLPNKEKLMLKWQLHTERLHQVRIAP